MLWKEVGHRLKDSPNESLFRGCVDISSFDRCLKIANACSHALRIKIMLISLLPRQSSSTLVEKSGSLSLLSLRILLEIGRYQLFIAFAIRPVLLVSLHLHRFSGLELHLAILRALLRDDDVAIRRVRHFLDG